MRKILRKWKRGILRKQRERDNKDKEKTERDSEKENAMRVMLREGKTVVRETKIQSNL